MRDDAIADLVLTAAEDMASASLNAGDAAEFLTQIVGWDKETILHWMADHAVCLGCIDNFEQNDSLYSPNDCVCEGT